MLKKRKIPPANLEDLSLHPETLLHHSKAVGLSGMEKYYTQYTTHTSVHRPALPQPLATSLYEKILPHDMSVIRLHCDKHKDAANVTKEQAAAIV